MNKVIDQYRVWNWSRIEMSKSYIETIDKKMKKREVKDRILGGGEESVRNLLLSYL